LAKDRKKSSADISRSPEWTNENVKKWLQEHPEFLEENSDLLTASLSAERVSDTGVVNMQSFLVERLQKETQDLKSLQGDLVSAARNNLATQQMVHGAVESLLDATGFAHFIHLLTQDLPDVLEVDVITLCIEDGAIDLPQMTGLQRLKHGNIARANWYGEQILMRPLASKSKAVFGPAQDLIQSDCLIRLDIPTLNSDAMLAVGSREAGHFHPEQGTDLIRFLANCIQSTLKYWLENRDQT